MSSNNELGAHSEMQTFGNPLSVLTFSVIGLIKGKANSRGSC